MQPTEGTDKIQWLIDETGCDRAQAATAMRGAGFDVEKAVRAIGALRRDIIVVKGKFAQPRRCVYGRALLIADRRGRRVLRTRVVVSRNPALYEKPVAEPWNEFEKALYVDRLADGAQPLASLRVERGWNGRLEQTRDDFFTLLASPDSPALTDYLAGSFAAAWDGEPPAPRFEIEVVDLDQFRRGTFQRETPLGAPTVGGAHGGPLVLTMALRVDDGGVSAEHLRAGDTVQARVADARDIARYLARLLGPLVAGAPAPFDVPVESVSREAASTVVRLRLSATLIGVARVSRGVRVSARRAEARPWWRRWGFFSRS